MPEIKLKHVVSFSSEDKVHKAENLLKPETYRKWKCATAGEKNASVILQFEKASKIQSIDIGNDASAFVEVLVGRSSDSINDFQVLLVASSFMSPLESRNETHTNRVRMFDTEKLSMKIKDEKWDCVQVVCTQPFNKNITYGLTFIKFHSPSEKNEEQPSNSETRNATAKIGAFNMKSDEEEEDSLITVGSWFGKKRENSQNSLDTSLDEKAPSYASSILASSTRSPKTFLQNTPKRKNDSSNSKSSEPPAKKPTTLTKEHIIYKSIFDDETPTRKNPIDKVESNNKQESRKGTNALDPLPITSKDYKKVPKSNKDEAASKPITNSRPVKPQKKISFNNIMKKVVFVLSGFVNPLRGDLRDRALEMGAKYKADWDSTCTHLICAFLNTPKYIQVRADNGRVVTKDWINDCYKKKTLLPWRSYMLGKYTKDTSGESDDADEDIADTRTAKPQSKGAKNNPVNSPSNRNTEDPASTNHLSQSTPKNVTRRLNDDSETEDEDALEDYMADTDVDADCESDSGGDTEDEIRKFENEGARRKTKSPNKRTTGSPKKNSLMVEKPDVCDLPLPELPNIFKQRHFFLFGKLQTSNQHDLQRYITAYNGILDDYMSDKIKYVITEEKWDQRFEEALSENDDLIFVKPLWIYKCHEVGKLVPYQPYIIIPDS